MSTQIENKPANTPSGENLPWYEREVPEGHARIRVYLEEDVGEVIAGHTEAVTICDAPIANVVSGGTPDVHDRLTLTVYQHNLSSYFRDHRLTNLIPPDSPFLKTPGAKFKIPPRTGEIRVFVKVPSEFMTEFDGLTMLDVADIPRSSLKEKKFTVLPSGMRSNARFGFDLMLDPEQLALLEIPVDPQALDAQRLLAMLSPKQ